MAFPPFLKTELIDKTTLITHDKAEQELKGKIDDDNDNDYGEEMLAEEKGKNSENK